jgi:hypothetical protein
MDEPLHWGVAGSLAIASLRALYRFSYSFLLPCSVQVLPYSHCVP